MKVYLEPDLKICANGGIRRVVEAQHKYLPEFGIELVSDPMAAEVEAAHVIGAPQNPDAAFVAHNHGMMWSEYNFSPWAEKINADIVSTIQQSFYTTVPSEWVKRAIARGMYKELVTVYHGIDTSEWQPTGETSKYILWNKARTDAVSNPEDMQKLAALLPDLHFFSTFGEAADNVSILRETSYGDMKGYVQSANLYLATARETFGIGTLEALACGVPVVGWDYGGQSEIIRQGETGYLAPFGDYGRLADCVRSALSERPRLSRNALDDVQARWQWRDKVEKYASLYYGAAAWYSAPRPKVTVVIPCHNLGRFLPYAILSLQQQSLTDFECIVVDDDSADETEEIGQMIAATDIRFRYHRTHQNLKLTGVRNYGAQNALGHYLLYLDADDQLTPHALEILADALDNDRTIDIAYGKLDLLNEAGTHQRSNAFPTTFNWYHQMAHQNQIPTAAMMRREVPLRSGGWRDRQWRAEDAEFWSRVTSFGYRAKLVTDQVTLLYRVRHDSKGSLEFRNYPDRDGNWLAEIAWRSANSAVEGVDYLKRNGDNVPDRDLVPFGAQGKPPGDKFWYVSHQQEPLVRIFINGSTGIIDTLDSLEGQYMNKWEVWVQGEPQPQLPQYVRYIDYAENLPDAVPIELVAAGTILPSDYLDQYGPPRAPTMETGKVLVEYTAENQGKIPFRTDGGIHLGYKGVSLYVTPLEAEQLISRGHWRRAISGLPAPAVSDKGVA